MSGGKGKMLFFAVWVALLVGSFAALHFEGRVQIGHGNSVAELKERSGTVQFRPKSMPIWSYAASGQHFYDGNVVATGAESNAIVALENGRELVVGPNSQVALTAADDARGDYVVTLISGTLTAQTSAAKKIGLAKTRGGALVVKLKDRTVKVASVESVLTASVSAAGSPVVKAEHAPVEVKAPGMALKTIEVGEVVQLAPEPVRAAPGSVRLATTAALKVTEQPVAAPLEPALVAPPAPPAPLAPPAAPEPVVKKDVEPAVMLAAKAPPKKSQPPVVPPKASGSAPRIKSPLPGATLWTAAPLSSAQGRALPVGLASTAKAGAKTGWFVTVAGQGSRPLSAIPEGEGARASIPATMIAAAATTEGNALAQKVLRLRAGVREGAAQTLGEPVALRLGSLTDLGAKPVRVTLGLVAVAGEGSGWLAEAKAIPEPAVTLTLRQGNDLASGISLLAGARTFRIDGAAALPTDAAVQLVRGGRVIASAQGADVGETETLRRGLRATYAYRGRASDLVEGFGGSPVAKRAALAARLQKSRALYVLQGKQLVKIEATLLQTNPAALDLIAETATAVFVERVEIMTATP